MGCYARGAWSNTLSVLRYETSIWRNRNLVDDLAESNPVASESDDEMHITIEIAHNLILPTLRP